MIKDFKIFDSVRWYYKGKLELDKDNIEQTGKSGEFKVGDYIRVIELPNKPHWLNDTEQRTYKLMGNPSHFAGGVMMWSTDGRFHDYEKPGYAGIPERCFRHATPKEIEDAYGVVESINENDPYNEERWGEDVLTPYHDAVKNMEYLMIKDLSPISFVKDIEFFNFTFRNDKYIITNMDNDIELWKIDPGYRPKTTILNEPTEKEIFDGIKIILEIE